MITCEECKKREVCCTCGKQVCRVHRTELKVCKIVGYYSEGGEFVCEKCHEKQIRSPILPEIDKAIVDKKCLEDFHSTSCCEIVEKDITFLVVIPTSSFKSSNCSYLLMLNKA